MARPPKGESDHATETESPVAIILEKMADKINELDSLSGIIERLLDRIGILESKNQALQDRISTLELKDQAMEDKVKSLQTQRTPAPELPPEISQSAASRILNRLGV